MSKQNCWEFMNCGREPGGVNAEKLGICLATKDESTDGINEGKNAGRICWAVAGTLCGGEVQGEFASKMDNCITCDFYHLVSNEQDHAVIYPNGMARDNCWEFKKCGREPSGAKIGDLGVCPAAIEANMTGINSGQNGGRVCWVVVGTLCGGEVQGEFATKLANCVTCDFYNKVLNEESDFVIYPE